MPLIRPLVLAIVPLSLAVPAHAQLSAPERVSIGAGVGATQSDRLSGRGWHVQVAVPTIPLGDAYRVVAEGLYQWGTIDGAPTTCAQEHATLCFGRTDRNRIAGLALQLRPAARMGDGPIRLYFNGGLGIYRRWTRSSESELVGGSPRFTTVETTRTAPGWSLGAGVEGRVGGLAPFVEVRAHRMLEGDGSKAGALPVTLGLRF